ncbi:hypothetical protein TNCV_2896211 [Trichonephila clavipes]|nr:hypothetical protein TNCV_2896211 [Trichonephila clavipes]
MERSYLFSGSFVARTYDVSNEENFDSTDFTSPQVERSFRKWRSVSFTDAVVHCPDFGSKSKVYRSLDRGRAPIICGRQQGVQDVGLLLFYFNIKQKLIKKVDITDKFDDHIQKLRGWKTLHHEWTENAEQEFVIALSGIAKRNLTNLPNSSIFPPTMLADMDMSALQWLNGEHMGSSRQYKVRFWSTKLDFTKDKYLAGVRLWAP